MMMSNLPFKRIIRDTLIVWGLVMLIMWLRRIFLLYFSIEALFGLTASILIALFEFYNNRNNEIKKKNISEVEKLRREISEISDKLDYNLLSLQNMSNNFSAYDVSLEKLKNDIHNKHIDELKEMNAKLFQLLKNEQFD